MINQDYSTYARRLEHQQARRHARAHLPAGDDKQEEAGRSIGIHRTITITNGSLHVFNDRMICGRSIGRGRPWDDSEFIGQQQTETSMRLINDTAICKTR